MKLIINRGLPASGKSTKTREDVIADYGNTVRVNRDDIRKMLHNTVFLGDATESKVRSARDDLLRGAMKRNVPTVISDDTNLDPGVVRGLAKIADFFGYGVEVRDFDVPLETCIERDSMREGAEHVGEKVIRGMHKKYFKNGKFPENPLGKIEAITFEPYVADLSKPEAVIFDADGTLFSHEGVRSPYDYTKVHLDAIRPKVARMAQMHYDHGDVIIIMSGRDSVCYDATAEAVHKIVPDFELFMRPEGDKRQDRIIKGELFNKYVRHNFNVHNVYDDRDQVVGLWRLELMLDCFQVNYGKF